jgi:hypothetical protein
MYLSTLPDLTKQFRVRVPPCLLYFGGPRDLIEQLNLRIPTCSFELLLDKVNRDA